MCAIAAPKVHRCVNQNGQTSFQDSPCPMGTTAGEANQDPSRWSTPVRRGATCALQSPMIPLRVQRNTNEFTQLEGGAKILLRTADSGIAASVVIEASWPVERIRHPNRADPSLVNPLQASANSAQRLELSGNIALHVIELSALSQDDALLASNTSAMGGSRFVVDVMDDATRMSFGFRQTAILLKAMRGARSLSVQLGLRNPALLARSERFDLTGLDAALRALQSCQEANKNR